ncbi:hypothetical protein C5167_026949 [Papaver somniferum]|nr:hypothetical protein C5167_026949 [Papaver somniferum]
MIRIQVSSTSVGILVDLWFLFNIDLGYANGFVVDWGRCYDSVETASFLVALELIAFRFFSTCLELGDICRKVGLPPGVLNIVTGLSPEAGAPLASHPHFDKAISHCSRMGTSKDLQAHDIHVILFSFMYSIGNIALLQNENLERSTVSLGSSDCNKLAFGVCRLGSYARAVWFSAGYRLDDTQWSSTKDWISSWFTELDSSTVAKMATICWLEREMFDSVRKQISKPSSVGIIHLQIYPKYS